MEGGRDLREDIIIGLNVLYFQTNSYIKRNMYVTRKLIGNNCTFGKGFQIKYN